LTSRDRAKDKRLRDIYNTTLEKQNEQRAKQNNGCAICGRSFEKFTPFQDHEHACCPRRLKKFCGNCLRGLLCFLCNKYVVGVIERQCKANNVKMTPLEFLDKIKAYLSYWTPILKQKGCYEEKQEKSTARKKKKSV
jgi:hypothetical protein